MAGVCFSGFIKPFEAEPSLLRYQLFCMANKLQHETSPYLLQHAHNPVDWYPWGPEALQKAKEENKLIVISIGYSACHWCHVMERESFEDAATAAVMNSNFVNIKVDREERPDLDQVYMDAVQAVTGSGGWPLNVFLTPDAKPFYGGTYFPPVRAYNRSSWLEVLHAINSAWRDKPQEILSQAENLTEHIRNASLFGSIITATPSFGHEQMAQVGMAILKSADKEWGGFGQAPKFPQTMSIQWLLRQYHYFNQYGTPADLPFSKEELLRQALLSLDKMMAGGIYDHLGGGFARYCTDAQWLVPHFEKMLYDNALLVSVFSEAFQLTKQERYKNVIRETMDFVLGEWQSEEGGFYSAFDADSEGEEGKYYTWSKGEIQSLLPDEEMARVFCEYYDVSDNGNWEGTNILWVREELTAFCQTRGNSVENVSQQLATARQLLLRHRSSRIRPLLDDKKLLGWNALMITACCKAANALEMPYYLERALKAVDFIENNMRDDGGNYFHNEKNGKAANPAFLDDLAYYAEALCHLHQATGDNRLILRAKAILEIVVADYSDEEGVYFYYTNVKQSDILLRKKETYDGATPAANSVMVWVLHYLGIVFDEPAWQERAIQLLTQVEKTAIRYPNSFGNWAQMMQQMAYGIWELAIVGPDGIALSRAVLNDFIPNKVLACSLEPDSDYPLLRGKNPGSGQTLIYACRQYACEAPVDSVSALRRQISSLSGGCGE
jgi:uncharacterized protein YyaL (SSP411 family)